MLLTKLHIRDFHHKWKILVKVKGCLLLRPKFPVDSGWFKKDHLYPFLKTIWNPCFLTTGKLKYLNETLLFFYDCFCIRRIFWSSIFPEGFMKKALLTVEILPKNRQICLKICLLTTENFKYLYEFKFDSFKIFKTETLLYLWTFAENLKEKECLSQEI